MKVWSATAKSTTLFKGSNIAGVVADYEGAELNLDYGVGKHKPFLRGLAFQAYQAYLKWNVIDPIAEPAPEDYSSHLSTNFSCQRLLGLKIMAEEVKSLIRESSAAVSEDASSRHLKRRREESEEDEDEDAI
jgi:hypothetical protein